jgi:competence protein ComEC
MLAGLAAWSVSALWHRLFFTNARLPLRLPAQKAAALTGAVVALLYVLAREYRREHARYWYDR